MLVQLPRFPDRLEDARVVQNASMTTLYQWTPLIIAHAAAATSALVIGATLLFKRKGDLNHRLMGWIWVGLMTFVALASFGIQRDGYSWIHVLSVLTLATLFIGVRHARRHKVGHHGRTMKGILFGGFGRHRAVYATANKTHW